MVVKTITVTQEAYNALKGMKEERESFSETLLRISGRRSILDFVGILSSESARKLKEVIKENRQRDTLAHEQRMKRIIAALEGRRHGSIG